eukprot:4125409-Pyramimonas_sp.AAC.1
MLKTRQHQNRSKTPRSNQPSMVVVRYKVGWWKHAVRCRTIDNGLCGEMPPAVPVHCPGPVVGSRNLRNNSYVEEMFQLAHEFELELENGPAPFWLYIFLAIPGPLVAFLVLSDGLGKYGQRFPDGSSVPADKE